MPQEGLKPIASNPNLTRYPFPETICDKDLETYYRIYIYCDIGLSCGTAFTRLKTRLPMFVYHQISVLCHGGCVTVRTLRSRRASTDNI